MVAQLPPEVSTFKVVGRLVRSVIDSNDPGQDPDMVPVSGARVTFTPTLNPPIFKIPTTSPPVTVYQETIVATTDTNGFLKAPTDTNYGVILPWGFSEGITPNGWNWSVKITGVGNFPERSFVISGTANGVIDLATVIPVPASPGSEIYAWEQIVDQVTRARDEAVAAAASLSDMADVYATRADVGDITSLATNNKISLVEAVNELSDRPIPNMELSVDPSDLDIVVAGTDYGSKRIPTLGGASKLPDKFLPLTSMRVNNGFIQWRVSDDADWEDLMDISDLAGVRDYGTLPYGTTVTMWYNGSWPIRPTNSASIVIQWCSIGYQGIPPTAIPGVDFLRVFESQPIPDPDPDPGVAEDGNVLGTYNFEDQADGFNAAATPPWGVFGGGTNNLVVKASSAIHGSLGGETQGMSSARYVNFTEANTVSDRVLDMYLKIKTHSVNAYVMQLSDPIALVTRADVRINANKSITIRNGSVAAASSEEGFALKANVVYRFSWMVTELTQRLRVYDTETSTWVVDISAPLSNRLGGEYRFATPVASVGTILDVDTFRVGDDWIPAYV